MQYYNYFIILHSKFVDVCDMVVCGSKKYATMFENDYTRGHQVGLNVSLDERQIGGGMGRQKCVFVLPSLPLRCCC